MSQVIEFPKNRGLSKKEIEKVSNMVEEAVAAHAALKEYATYIKADPRLDNIRNDILLKTLSLMLEDDK